MEGASRDKKGNWKINCKRNAPAANRTRGPSMATMDFTTKPLALVIVVEGLVQKFYLCGGEWEVRDDLAVVVDHGCFGGTAFPTQILVRSSKTTV